MTYTYPGTVCAADTLSLGLSFGLKPFVHRLFSMDNRIRLYPFVTDLEPDKAFFVKKEGIFIPYAIPAPEHEIAHMCEMQDQSRWLLPDWGLAFPQESAEKSKCKDPAVKFFDRYKSPKIFFAAMAREIRVRGIQLHMEPEEIDKKDSTVFHILNNQFAWGGSVLKGHLPFGRFRIAKDVEDWAADLRDKTYKAWNLPRIEHEWGVRLTHMQNWMETKEAA
jgi:hypothetical protein